MAASGSILPNPKMYFVDNNGEPLGSGFLYTRRSLDPTQNKFVFQDAGLTLPYPDPIRIDANGTVGPIFWAADELYYIYVTDVNGFQIWSMDGYGPAIAGGGGGGTVTTAIDLENLVQNNTFYRNSINANSSITSVGPVPTFLTLAPGAHSGFSGNTALATTTGSPAQDICFIKSSAAAADNLSFGIFPLGSGVLTNDVTPVYYLHYDSNAGNEAFKYVQFPICSGAQNLSNQTVTGRIWVKWNSGDTNLTFYWRQFYGDGPSASAEQRISAPIALIADGAWHPYPITLSIPNASTKNLGECGNDGLFMQIEFSLNQPSNIDFTKPAIYLGANTPKQDFHSNDQIEAIANDFRTGDVRSSLNAFSPYGWVPLDDGTIGSKTSGATTRANRDTFPLYALLWNGVSDTYAPVITGRGATAIADFSANKQLTLTRMLGRVLGEAGSGAGLTTRTVGQYLGEETHVLTVPEMPSHAHNVGTNTAGAFGNPTITAGLTATSDAGQSSAVGGGGAHNNMQPTSFVNMYIKL